MKRLSSILQQWGPTLLLGLVVFLFWWKGYPHALSYQEQFQLFLFDGDYFARLLSLPGGVAAYVSEFLVQFYNNVAVGAFVLALLFMLMHRLCIALASQQSPSTHFQSLIFNLSSFISPLFLLFTMGDESVLLAFAVSLVFLQLMMLLWPRRRALQVVYVLAGLPLFYWLAGPLVLVLALYLTVRLILDADRRGRAVLVAAVVWIYAIALIEVSQYFVSYPLASLFCGLFYYRFIQTVTLTMVITALLFIALPLVVSRLPEKLLRGRLAVGVSAACVVVMLILVPFGYETKKYDLIEYDYFVRLRNWDAVIAKSEKNTPTLPMGVCANNLALGMKGQLLNRYSEFYQHGSEGLLLPFEHNFTYTQLTGEVYFNLGLVNTAQRYAFESMESLPDFRKSVRVIKRLAETNLINGQYAVARKYLSLLKKTMFYRLWAERTEQLLGNEQAINAHPLYGWLRKIRLHDDFLFSQQETDKICGQLFLHNPENLMAMQYLLAHPLLDGDMQRLRQYQQVVEQKMKKK